MRATLALNGLIKNRSKQSTRVTLQTQYTQGNVQSQMIISHFPDDVWHGTANEKFEGQLDNQKNGTHEFADCDSRTKLLTKWSDIVFIYNQEENNIVKKTPLDYQTLYPNNFEKQKRTVFCECFQRKSYCPIGTW